MIYVLLTSQSNPIFMILNFGIPVIEVMDGK